MLFAVTETVLRDIAKKLRVPVALVKEINNYFQKTFLRDELENQYLAHLIRSMESCSPRKNQQLVFPNPCSKNSPKMTQNLQLEQVNIRKTGFSLYTTIPGWIRNN